MDVFFYISERLTHFILHKHFSTAPLVSGLHTPISVFQGLTSHILTVDNNKIRRNVCIEDFQPPPLYYCPGKHDTSTQCLTNVGPTS